MIWKISSTYMVGFLGWLDSAGMQLSPTNIVEFEYVSRGGPPEMGVVPSQAKVLQPEARACWGSPSSPRRRAASGRSGTEGSWAELLRAPFSFQPNISPNKPQPGNRMTRPTHRQRTSGVAQLGARARQGCTPPTKYPGRVHTLFPRRTHAQCLQGRLADLASCSSAPTKTKLRAPHGSALRFPSVSQQ